MTIQSIKFGVWAPDQNTFWQSWADAGIVEKDEQSGDVIYPIQFTNEYQGISTTADSWHGKIISNPGNPEADPPVAPTYISGWHCNVIVYGPSLIDPTMEGSLTYGLDQHDADGNLKSIWDRTWADLVFSLTPQPADPTTGFPAGYRNATGVTYCDPAEFSSPSNIIL
jgi:hypothetical protein